MLETHDVHKIYSQDVNPLHVLKGVNLRIEAGDTLAIVGPSGAGKSTLLHILGGLDTPSQGDVAFDSQNVYKMSDVQRSRLRNQQFGFVFQFYHLLSEFTALENVFLPGLVQGDKQGGSLKTKAMDLLDRIGLKSRAQHKPFQLSGGEQQRVAIARALINDPKIIFCDEPTGNLDSESGQDVINLLMDLNHKNCQTLVMVTHDESIAKRCQRILRMRDGMVVA
ncbi:MAG: ABC transporter ATP-binding protein [Candidatus Omnitrophica bacterium]|nr:ABC transporter ATP-binding protein [Candidatus Omnitrophota bacterium]